MARRDRTIVDDNVLVERLDGPDWADALATLWDRHSGLLFNTARATCRSEEDAQDAIGDAFTSLFVRAEAGTLKIHSSFRALAVTSVRNAAIGRYRKVKREDLDDSAFDSAVADDMSLPPDRFLADAESDMMAVAFASLPERSRTVLWQTQVEGLTPREVAEITGIKANNVAQIASRSRKELRTAYVAQHLTLTPTDPICAEIQSSLPAWVTNELNATSSKKVSSHLETCDGCREVLHELEDDTRSLRGLIIPPLAGLVGAGALLLRVKPASALSASGSGASGSGGSHSSGLWRTTRSSRRLRWLIAGGTAAVVAVAAVLLFIPHDSNEEPPRSLDTAASEVGLGRNVICPEGEYPGTFRFPAASNQPLPISVTLEQADGECIVSVPGVFDGSISAGEVSLDRFISHDFNAETTEDMEVNVYQVCRDRERPSTSYEINSSVCKTQGTLGEWCAPAQAPVDKNVRLRTLIGPRTVKVRVAAVIGPAFGPAFGSEGPVDPKTGLQISDAGVELTLDYPCDDIVTEMSFKSYSLRPNQW